MAPAVSPFTTSLLAIVLQAVVLLESPRSARRAAAIMLSTGARCTSYTVATQRFADARSGSIANALRASDERAVERVAAALIVAVARVFGRANDREEPPARSPRPALSGVVPLSVNDVANPDAAGDDPHPGDELAARPLQDAGVVAIDTQGARQLSGLDLRHETVAGESGLRAVRRRSWLWE